VLIGAITLADRVTADSGQSPAAKAAATLTGGWKLNEAASDNPNGTGERGASTRSGRPPDRQDMSGPPPGGQLGAEEGQRFNFHLRMFSQAAPLLGIQATAEQVMLVLDPDPSKGLAYKLVPDNKKVTVSTPAGPIEMRARWDGAKLRREIETRESLKVVEEYIVSADGKQLTVHVKRSSVMVRLTGGEITRVYDRVQ
jgi:hypothetical protein